MSNKYLFMFCLLTVAAPLFSENNTALASGETAVKTCICRLPDGKRYKCLCSDPHAIRVSDNKKAAAQTAGTANGIVPTDLIDKSSTASHINPEAWQERNPQHVEKNNPFDVLKKGKTTAPQAGQNGGLDAILNAAPADYHPAESSAAKGAGEEVISARDNEETLLRQAAANKAAARQTRENNAAANEDSIGALGLTLLNAAANGTLNIGSAAEAVTGGASGNGLTREACNSDRATCMKCCAVECPNAHCAYHANSKWRDNNGMIIRCGCE